MDKLFFNFFCTIIKNPLFLLLKAIKKVDKLFFNFGHFTNKKWTNFFLSIHKHSKNVLF